MRTALPNVVMITALGCSPAAEVPEPFDPPVPTEIPATLPEWTPAEPSRSTSFDLTVLHVGATDGHLLPTSFPYDVSGLALDATADASGSPLREVTVRYGGQLALVHELHERQRGANALTVHTGGVLGASAATSLFGAEVEERVARTACYDVFMPGASDLAAGEADLAGFLGDLTAGPCSTRIVATNLQTSDTSPLATVELAHAAVVDVKGHPVGVVGAIDPWRLASEGGADADFRLEQVLPALQEAVDGLVDAGIGRIVVVSSGDLAGDRELASLLTDVDVVLGSGSLLGDTTLDALGFPVEGPFGKRSFNRDGDLVCVSHAWEGGRVLGELLVHFEGDVVSACGGQAVLPVDGLRFGYAHKGADGTVETRELGGMDAGAVAVSLTTRPGVVPAVADVRSVAATRVLAYELRALDAVSLGTLDRRMCAEHWPGQGRGVACDREDAYASGSLAAALVARAFLAADPGADLALLPAGLVRDDLASGSITELDLLGALPDAGALVRVALTGQEILDLLEDALAHTLDDGGSTGSFPMAAGLRFAVDASLPYGSRVVDVTVDIQGMGAAGSLDAGQLYGVVVPEALLDGRLGYALPDTPVEVDVLAVDAVASWFDRLERAGVTSFAPPAEQLPVRRYVGRDGCEHLPDGPAVCHGF